MTYGIVARRRQAHDANATILAAPGRDAVEVRSVRQPCEAFSACIFARSAQLWRDEAGVASHGGPR